MSWKQLQLFDYTPIRDPNYGSADPLYSDPALAAVTSSRSYLVLATHSMLRLVDPSSLSLTTAFFAYDPDYTISFLAAVPESDLVVSLAEKQGAPAIIRLWDVHKIARKEKAKRIETRGTETRGTGSIINSGNHIPSNQSHTNANSTNINANSTNSHSTNINSHSTNSNLTLNPTNSANSTVSPSSIDTPDLRFKFVSQALVTNGDNSYPVSAFQFTRDLTCMAVGYANGCVALVRGDMIRDRGTKQRLVYELPDPVTGLEFNTLADVVYVTTTSQVLTVATNGRNNGRASTTLAKLRGVALHCTAVDESSQNLIVANDDGIVLFNHTTTVQVLPYKCPKSRIFKATGNYLCMVSLHEEDVLDTRRRLVTRVLVLDMVNTHVSFNLMLPNTAVAHVWEEEGGAICVLATDGVLYRIQEKPISEQIDVLVDRGLYATAYQLAIQNKQSDALLLAIQIAHADDLYDRGEFDAALKMYVRCLLLYERMGEKKEGVKDLKVLKEESKEVLENLKNTSGVSLESPTLSLSDFVMAVITKFKDVANIANLAHFLLRLYEMHIAKNDHITLLLCCYCKMRATDELDHFIASLDVSDASLQDLNFQMIINLFKECGFLTQAISLLHKLNQPVLIVDIQLNDLFQQKECLAYIKTLQIDDLLLVLIEHSKTLLDYLPIETTELLINVFTGKYTPRDLLNVVEAKRTTSTQPEKVSSTLSSYAAFLSYLKTDTDANDEDGNEDNDSAHVPTYLPPRPSLIYPSFINHTYEFVIFLEACIEAFDRYQGALDDKKELLITLLEMYLSLSAKLAARNTRMGREDEWKMKARGLIEKNSALLDSTSLLLISHIYGFREGEAIALEQSGYAESLFRSYEISKDYSGCLHIAKKYGDSKPDLYKLMLQFAISERSIFEQCTEDDFSFLLGKIHTMKLMTPLELLQILTSDPDKDYLTLGLIKGYLVDYIRDQTKEINNNVTLIEYYETESTKNLLKLKELELSFTLQNNKCLECGLMLDYPVVHFHCKHSYHLKCLTNNLVAHRLGEEKLCPKCINELDEIASVRRDFAKSKEMVDIFEANLADSKDRFKFMSEQLGRGLMEEESVTVE